MTPLSSEVMRDMAALVANESETPWADPELMCLETGHVDHIVVVTGEEKAFQMLPAGANGHYLHVNHAAMESGTPHVHLWLATYSDGATAGIWAIPSADGRRYELRRFSSLPWSHWPRHDYREIQPA